MHPKEFQYLGFDFENQLYCLTHLLFGLSSACHVYPVIMGEVFYPLRQEGLRMTYLIGDVLYAFKSKGEAATKMYVILRLLIALGFFLSFDKMHADSWYGRKVLGLLVLVSQQGFKIPMDDIK